MKKKLQRGDRLQLKTRHTFPLEMSPIGGVFSDKKLEVAAGTKVVVAEDCEPYVFNIPIHFADELLKKQGGSQPFFTNRQLLVREVIFQFETGN
jgi:hypothetical protein